MKFRLFGSPPSAPAPDTQPPDFTTLDDVAAAYRLVLKREPDPDGLSHYAERVRQGLRLDDLIGEMMASDERRRRVAEAATHASHREAATNDAGRDSPSSPTTEPVLIRPDDIIRRYSVEELNETADEYYRRIDDVVPLLQKPFASLQETPPMLEHLGALLGGLQLGKTMTVLDFGAGTCWLSRILCELHCRVIACDVSKAALDIGRRLFEEHPPVGRHVRPPVFLPFDGHRIDLEDGSVDRVISFDAFHHVPNPDEVLAELARVLRPGGIIGFSEPGRFHSQTPQSQYEMRHHRVLENDIDVEALFERAKPLGFTALTLRVQGDLHVPVADYLAGIRDGRSPDVQQRVWQNIVDTQNSLSIFFLRKGEPTPDSRAPIGLAHAMTLIGPSAIVSVDDTVTLSFRIRNSGTARWLDTNTEIFGVVRLAAHLQDGDGRLVDVDYFRHGLPHAVEAGETVEMTVTVPLPDLPACRLVFDVVAEGVRWFEAEGSTPVEVSIRRPRDTDMMGG